MRCRRCVMNTAWIVVVSVLVIVKAAAADDAQAAAAGDVQADAAGDAQAAAAGDVQADAAGDAQDHKVHNLLLYPDKQEWCEGMQIEMILTHPGCQPLKLANRVCAGQCFSYTSPRTRPANRMEDELQHCSHCVPSNVTWQQVTFECDTERYQSFTKEVELIHECACSPCFPDNHQPQQQKSIFDSYVYEYDADDGGVYADIDVANERMAQRVVHNSVEARPAGEHNGGQHLQLQRRPLTDAEELVAYEHGIDAAAQRHVVAGQARGRDDDVIAAMLAEQRRQHGPHYHTNNVNAHARVHNVHNPASRHHGVQEQRQVVDGYT